jgi:SAM-dependent methyltransferase
MSQYDSVAYVYARRIAPKYEPIARLLLDHVAPRASDTILEVAIGTGVLARQLAPAVLDAGRYLALDVSAPMLRLSRESLDPRIVLLQADASRLPLPDAHVDLVVSSLGPVQGSADACAEAWRVLRSGGELALSTWGEDYKEFDLLKRARARLAAGEFPATSLEDAVATVAGAGFRFHERPNGYRPARRISRERRPLRGLSRRVRPRAVASAGTLRRLPAARARGGDGLRGRARPGTTRLGGRRPACDAPLTNGHAW